MTYIHKEKDKQVKTKKVGRPSSFSDEMDLIICDRMMSGESLRKICQDPTMPDKKTVLVWLRDNPVFRVHYDLARQMQLDFMAHEIIDIADDTTEDDIFTEAGNRVANSEWIARSRLRIDARKWIMAKLMPKKWGEKLEVDNKGEVGLNITVKQYTKKDEE